MAAGGPGCSLSSGRNEEAMQANFHPDKPARRRRSTSARILALLLLALLGAAGCSLFETKKQPLPGERISVLTLDRQLAPDPALANIPVALPRPEVNKDWPEP